MKRFACMAMLLLSPGLLFAAPTEDANAITGLWKVEGNMMGTAVRMMCALTEVNHKLSGICSGAQDGYAAHKIAGSVKEQKVEFYFQTAIGGNPLTLIVNGTLNEDRTRLDGGMDVEPMAVGGLFSAMKELEHNTAEAQTDTTAAQAWAAEAQAGLATGNEAAADAGAEAATAATPGPAQATVQQIATGTWNIHGDVQGTPVVMTCVLTEQEHKLAGSCTSADEDRMPRALTGATTAKGVGWRFDTEYQGQPITVSMSATMGSDGTKMNGSMSVAPMGVDGTFVAVRQ